MEMPDILIVDPPYLVDLSEKVTSLSEDQRNEIERVK
jgi:hypothetical protein